MKYKHLMECIDKDCIDKKSIDCIALSKDLFEVIIEEIYGSNIEINNKFDYDGISFILDLIFNYNSYAIVYFKELRAGYGYMVLTENERLIKNIIE